MLKITKGLIPATDNDINFIDDDNGVISIYTDINDDKYVRVTTKDEDFCIAAFDYTVNDYNEGEKYYFDWDEAMQILDADEMDTFTKRQAQLCIDHQDEINDKLKEIGGLGLISLGYWTSDEYDTRQAWDYCTHWEQLCYDDKKSSCCVRPILNL